MALLTADDVLNKKFQPTKFREGYDQDEVDDFLDEVVHSLRAVYAENEELKARIAELEADGGSAAPVAAAEVVDEQVDVVADAPAEPVAFAAPAAAEQPAAVEAVAGEGSNEPESATGMLLLAQRLHDEYVNNGKAEADRLLNEARAESDRITGEADETRNRTLSQLEGERSLLERKIDELRVFERDYRTRLKSYLEGLLSDVEGRGNVSSGLTAPNTDSGDQRRI